MITKFHTFLIATLFLPLLLTARQPVLTDRAKISLITIGPGEELYSSFGHSAFWVYDPLLGIDKIYNYGTFDFQDPQFYSKFTRGKLLYRLSVSQMGYLLGGAQQDNRKVTEQILNLPDDLKNELFRFLENNALPQNREYKYDFYYDNCSTRLRDALKKICGEKLAFHTTPPVKSFRQWLDPFLIDKQWQDMFMDVGQGTPADKIASPYNYMFLPDFLKESFDTATINIEGKNQPLVKSSDVLFEAPPIEEKNSFLTPALFFWICFALTVALTIYQLRKTKPGLALDLILLIITGLLGCLILFLWFGTDHVVTKNNWNLMWAMPLNIIMAFLLFKTKKKQVFQKYFLAYGILMVLLLIIWKLIPQELNQATLPFILILIVRSFFIYYKSREFSRSRTTHPTS